MTPPTALVAPAAAAPPQVHAPRLLGAPVTERPAHPDAETLIAALEAARLTGRGGAGFPTATKLRAFAAASTTGRSRSTKRATGGPTGRATGVVVGNAMEGESLSRKDASLLATVPHLVVEGLLATVRALGAERAVIATGPRVPTAPLAAHLLEHPADRTGRGVEVVCLAGGFLAGQESALVNALSGRAAVPSDPLVRVTTRGVDARPTLVLNVETLARIALVLRHGPAGARTRLLSVSGAVARPGVVEVDGSATVREVVESARPDAFGAVLVGGYHGSWRTPDELDVAIDDIGIGAGVVHVLGHDTCPLRATMLIADHLAGASAGQCGPCVNALPRVADSLRRLAEAGGDPALPAEIARLSALATGRGACAHPDATVRMVLSALRAFGDDVAAHLAGHCLVRGPIPRGPIPRGAITRGPLTGSSPERVVAQVVAR